MPLEEMPWLARLRAKWLKMGQTYSNYKQLFRGDSKSVNDIPKKLTLSLTWYRVAGFLPIPKADRFKGWLRPLIRYYPHLVLFFITTRTLIFILSLVNLLTWRDEAVACYSGDLTMHLGGFGVHYNFVILPVSIMGILSMVDIFLPSRFNGLWIKISHGLLVKRQPKSVGLENGPQVVKLWRHLFLIAKINALLVKWLMIRVTVVLAAVYYINWTHGCPWFICLVWWLITNVHICLSAYALFTNMIQIYFAVAYVNFRLAQANDRIKTLGRSYQVAFEFNLIHLSIRLMATCQGYLNLCRTISKYSLIYARYLLAAALLYLLYACMMYHYIMIGHGVPQILMTSFIVPTFNTTIVWYGILSVMSKTHLEPLVSTSCLTDVTDKTCKAVNHAISWSDS